MVSSNQDSAHSGAMAIDGNAGTQWQTEKVKGKNKSNSEWIEVDLGSIRDISQVILKWGAYFATTYSIDVSNNQSAWTTVFGSSNGDGGLDTITFNTVQVRYVRLISTAWSSTAYRIWLNEFEVYTAGTTPNPSPTPTSTDTVPIATPVPTATPTPTPTPGTNGSIHVGDLDDVSNSNGSRWDAMVIILVHDGNESPLQGVTVNGSWSNGTSGGGNCTTSSDGTCTINRSNLKNNVSSVTFSITDLSFGLPYQAGANHDPDGDSDGKTIVIVKP
jgi:hypothetical protein